MNSFIKYRIILLIFISVYLNFYIIGFAFGLKNNILNSYDYLFFLFYFLCFLDILYILKKYQILCTNIFLKIIIFTVFLIIYFFIEQLIIHLTIFNIGYSDGWIRNNIYENIDYQFTWFEVLYWNFIFSIHYPLYIFIFFKPFVNHLDKSIRKIKNSKFRDKFRGQDTN